MKLQNMKRGLQKGFTLVELAIVLVIAGIILVAVLKGTDAVNKAKVERMVADLKGLQGTLLEFHKRTGRLAGDCSNNSVIANNTLPISSVLLNTWTTVTGTSLILDNTETLRTISGTPVAATTAGAGNGVCTTTAIPESDINLPWNELRRAGVVDANRLPRELARHGFNDVFAIGTMTDAAATSSPAGTIVVYGIPVWMAEAVDAAIDGVATAYGAKATAGGPANTGRVRLWSGTGSPMTPGATANDAMVFTAGANTNSYDEGANDRDRLIAISYQYTENKLLN